MQERYNGVHPRLGIWEGIRLAAHRLLDFKGRSRRSEFWPWFILLGLLSWTIFILDMNRVINVGAFSIILVLIFIFLRMGVSIRRLHDIGRSGTIVLIWAFAGIIFHLSKLFVTKDGQELFSSDFLVICLLVYNLLMLVVMLLALKDGEKGDNRFDISPKYY